MKSQYDDTGQDLFKPLIDKGLAPRDIISKLKTNHGKFFSNIPPSYSERSQYKKDLKGYNDLHGDILNKMLKSDRDDYFFKNPRPKLLTVEDRPKLSKALGRFTLEALSNIKNNDFQGIKLDSNLKSKGLNARGLFQDSPAISEIGRAIYLNPNVKKQDILSTIVHEGNHAIEHYNPYITNTIQSFLNKKLDEKQSKLQSNKQANLSKDYLPNLYKGIQDIIGLNDEFGDNYKITNSYQNEEINKDKLNYLKNYRSTYGNYLMKNPLGERFEEIPAFALETLMRKQQPWIINENTNDDSRRLLRRIMKEQQQQYRNLGLVDKTKPLNSNVGYNYNKIPVQYYETPTDRPNYKLVDNAFIEKIQALKKRNPIQQRTTTTSTTPTSIQTFQNPIQQSMIQNQSPYYGNQLRQLIQQGDVNKRSREDFNTEIDNPINKRNRLNPLLNAMAATTTTTPTREYNNFSEQYSDYV